MYFLWNWFYIKKLNFTVCSLCEHFQSSCYSLWFILMTRRNSWRVWCGDVLLFQPYFGPFLCTSARGGVSRVGSGACLVISTELCAVSTLSLLCKVWSEVVFHQLLISGAQTRWSCQTVGASRVVNLTESQIKLLVFSLVQLSSLVSRIFLGLVVSGDWAYLLSLQRFLHMDPAIVLLSYC